MVDGPQEQGKQRAEANLPAVSRAPPVVRGKPVISVPLTAVTLTEINVRDLAGA
jgi:hypothetical protein